MGYLTHEKALKMWRECLGIDYMTNMEYLIEVYKWGQENNGQYKKFLELSEKEYKKEYYL